MSRDPFAGVLDPFAYWDISATYSRYSAFFDLVIYCTIFIAVAHVVFTRQFTGRAGKALASAIGLALGISLAVAGQQFGFSLREAGPIAVLIALLLVGFLLMHVMIRVHISWALAAPLTFVIIYLFVRATSPALFQLIANRVPFINLLAAIIFLICVWKVGVALWPDGNKDGATSNDLSFVSSLNQKDEIRAYKAEKQIKRRLAPHAEHEAKRALRSLKDVERELSRQNPHWDSIPHSLNRIAHEEDDVIQLVDKILTLDRRLRNFDWQEIQHLNSYYKELNEQDRSRLKEQIHMERSKIVEEHSIEQLCVRCERRHKIWRKSIDDTARAVSMQDQTSAHTAVSNALRLESEQVQDIKALRAAEKRLVLLSKRKLKKERKS